MPNPKDTPINYRIFVGAFPEGPAAEIIQAWRQQYDPVTARITPPHVTLWGTVWRSGPPTTENESDVIGRLTHLCTTLPSFEMTIGEVALFEPRVVYLKAGPPSTLTSVRAELLRSLGPDKHRQFTPHLTLAMRLDSRQTRAMLADLQANKAGVGGFTCTMKALRLMQRGPDDAVWRQIACAKLGEIPCVNPPSDVLNG